jgi:NAD(P)-dependent dehydrogenase (short-subunit alcohol dehydrogenase family)
VGILDGRILDSKVAIVTGAGHGVGRGEALDLAAEGAKIVVNDLGGSVTGEGADKRPAEEVAEIIRSRGGEAVANYDDVADFNGAKSIIDQAVETYGTLDIVVNNAGILRDRMIFSMTEDDFDAVIRVHLKGTWCMSRHASAYWREQSKAGNQPRAAIVNTVSSAGLQGQASQSNYGAAKAGIAAMTIITSLELGRYGVRVNAIAPGGFTRMVGQAMKNIEIKEPDAYTEFNAMNPGNSAPMVAWLASDQALHVTGQVFRAVGNTIAHYQPWQLGELFESKTKEGPTKWQPADIGPTVNAFVFRSRNPGMVLPGSK